MISELRPGEGSGEDDEEWHQQPRGQRRGRVAPEHRGYGPEVTVTRASASLVPRAAADADILEREAVHGDLLVGEALVLLALAGVRPLPEHRGHGGAAVLAGGQLVAQDLSAHHNNRNIIVDVLASILAF